MTSLAERVTALERDLDELKRLIHGAMSDPLSVPMGRAAAAEHADIQRRMKAVERELHALIRWASGSRQ